MAEVLVRMVDTPAWQHTLVMKPIREQGLSCMSNIVNEPWPHMVYCELDLGHNGPHESGALSDLGGGKPKRLTW